jgi:hypothetical protein
VLPVCIGIADDRDAAPHPVARRLPPGLDNGTAMTAPVSDGPTSASSAMARRTAT